MKKNKFKIVSLILVIGIIVGIYIPILIGKNERRNAIEEYLYIDKGYDKSEILDIDVSYSFDIL